VGNSSSSKEAAAATTTIKHISRKQLQLTSEEASRRALETLPALLASKRLVLILDLDHTLLNSVRESDVTGEERKLLQQYMQQQAEAKAGGGPRQASAAAVGPAAGAAAAVGSHTQQGDKVAANGVISPTVSPSEGVGKDTTADAAGSSREQLGDPGVTSSSSSPSTAGAKQQPQQQDKTQPVPRCPWPLQPQLLYHLYDKSLWTKLRPGVFDFLAAASQMYELHIYTMGDKSYAGLIAKLLDPTGKLFGDRVISQVGGAPGGWRRLCQVGTGQHVAQLAAELPPRP
jgi:RNA polymerase II C-terminal domain phosphatase-like 3/4